MKWLFIREFRQEKKSAISSIVWTCVVLSVIVLIFVLKKSLTGELTNFINTMLSDVSEVLKFDFPAVTDVVWSFVWFVVNFSCICISWENLFLSERIFLRDERNRQVYIMCNQLYSRKKLLILKLLMGVLMFLLQYFLLCMAIIIITFAGVRLEVIAFLNVWEIVIFCCVWFAVNILLMSLLFLYIIVRKKHTEVNKIGFLMVILFVSFLQIKFGVNMLQAGAGIILAVLIILLCLVLYEKRDF